MSVALTLNADQERQLRKDNLIKSFFQVGASERTEGLEQCKHDCEQFIRIAYDEEIEDLIKIIEAHLINFKTNDKKRAINHVKLVWDKLYLKPNLTFYDIRFQTCIMFVESNIENLVYLAEEMIKQLDANYQAYKDYLRVKLSITVNLLDILVESISLNSHDRNKFESKALLLVEEIINLNIKYDIVNKYAIGRAVLYKGILLKDQLLIQIAYLTLKESEGKLKDIDEFIKCYSSFASEK